MREEDLFNRNLDHMERFVPGFKDYTGERSTVTPVDIILWAIMCGAFGLVEPLWRLCDSPLRVALLVQSTCKSVDTAMCKLKGDQDADYAKELRELGSTFGRLAIGLLDQLPDSRMARRLLLSKESRIDTIR